MNYIERMEYWGDHHHPRYMDVVRMFLGIFLVFKGVEFARDTSSIINLVSGQVPFSEFMVLILIHYVIFVHVFGGFLITLGLLTRAACIFQIPVLLGAIVFVNWEMMGYFSGFWLAILTLILLIVFTIIGSGPWSVDRAIEEKRIR